MKPKLSRAGIQLREQFDDNYGDRDRRSDGWIADARHTAAGNSDHVPCKKTGYVRAIDVDRDVSGKAKPDLMPYIVDQIVRACKTRSEKRISYIIFDGFIYSSKFRFIKRKYKGANKHTSHAHFSFKKEADLRGEFYQIPMLGGDNVQTK
jgi:hypothetical protein